jgi:RNA polymerase sigma factor (sigma-70 family)
MGDAFDEWYRASHPRVFMALVVSTADRDAATEAVDEAFAKAWAHWSRVQGMSNPIGWTYRVARNELTRSWRRRAREVAGAPVPVEGWDPHVGDPDLWAQVRRLPDRQREAIALRYIAELTQPEIARAMRIRPGTVAATLNAARASLRTTIEAPQWPAPSPGSTRT